MSYDSVQKELESHFETEWNGDTDIKWQNKKYKPKIGTEAFVSFNFLPGASSQISIGGEGEKKQFRFPAEVIIQIFIAQEKGQRLALTYADRVCQIFRAKTLPINKIVCRSPGVTPVGPSNNWYQMNVVVPLYWDEFLET